MIEDYEIFEAVRRGYNELEYSSHNEIIDYFDGIQPDAMMGHISNIKGIVFEQEITEALNTQGLEAIMFESTNHPISDIALIDDEEIAAEIQLKATDSISYIHETLEAHPDIPIVVTSEIANNFDTPMIIDSGIDNLALETSVAETLLDTGTSEISNEIARETVNEGLAEAVGESLLPVPVSKIGFISAIGAFFGLPFF